MGAQTSSPHSRLSTATFFLLFLFLAFCSPLLICHLDLGQHLRTGELILSEGRLPMSDPWAYTTNGYRWLVSAWAWDCVAWLLFSSGDYLVLLFLTCCLGAGIGASLAASARYSGANEISSLLSAFIILVCIISYEVPELPVSISPQTITLFVFAVFSLHLRKRQWRLPYFSPLLIALWSNLHAGVISGLILLAYALFVQCLRFQRPPAVRQLLLFLLCLLAPLASPYPFSFYENIYRHFTSPSAQFIYEWLPYRFPQCPLLSLFIGLFVLSPVFVPLKKNWEEYLLAGFWLCMGLQHQRNMAIFLTAAAPIFALLFSHFVRYIPLTLPPRKYIIIFGTASFLLSPIIIGSRFPGKIEWPSHIYPKIEIDYLLEHFRDRRLYNHWNFGSFIIFRAPFKIPIFVDGRGATAYPPELLRDLRDMSFADIVQKYRIEVVMLPNKPDALTEIDRDPQWKLKFRGPTAAIYARSDM